MGFPHPDFLLRLLTVKQLRDWELYYELEPFGQPEEALERGFTRYINAISSGAKKKSGGEFKIMDFVLDTLRKPKKKQKQTPEEMKSILMGISKNKGK